MTEKQKDLFVRDLCARLPYGVRIHSYCLFDQDSVDPLYSLRECNGKIKVNDLYYIEEIKPYLFPMSSMTKEQEKDIFDNGNFYIDRRNSLCRFPKHEDDYDFVTMEDCLEIFNKFNKYHIDFRGLIPMGLAIDASGLNIY